jgi:hypothetical protein
LIPPAVRKPDPGPVRNDGKDVEAVNRLGKVALTEGQREALREVLADELCSTGLKQNGEPNERGLKLDAIIGKLMYY